VNIPVKLHYPIVHLIKIHGVRGRLREGDRRSRERDRDEGRVREVEEVGTGVEREVGRVGRGAGGKVEGRRYGE
jgi:hypothetical protein